MNLRVFSKNLQFDTVLQLDKLTLFENFVLILSNSLRFTRQTVLFRTSFKAALKFYLKGTLMQI